MSPPAITLEVLPAGFGDCLLVSCPVGRSTWRMLVDTGPDETYPALRHRLLQIPQDAAGKRNIDLFVVSHIDHDHIGGARLLLSDEMLNLRFGDIWFNAPPGASLRGVAEGQSLADILGGADKALPWNQAWSGKPVCTPAEGGGVELTGPGLPKVTLLSPTPDRLSDLFKVWAVELERLRRKERDRIGAERPSTRGAAPTIEVLAAQVTPTDKAVPNGSSIAFLLEHQGASVLLGADAFPTVLVPALNALAKRRGHAGPMPLDGVKLSHHGSRANVTQELMKAVDAKHFVFSTNNSYFRHPNAEAVARVILAARKPTLWFNYDTPFNRQWGAAELTARYGHVARYPESGSAGIKLELAAQRKVRAR
jgi:beta-lactamase superfamily II metal-dependent hydrolase